MLEKINKKINKIFLNKTKSNYLIYLLIFKLGSFLSLAFAPFNLAFVAPIIISVFFVIIDNTHNKKQIFLRTFFFSFGFYIFGFYWICNSLLINIYKYGWLIPFAITLIPSLMALYFASLIYLYKYLIHKFKINFLFQKIILFSVFWLIFEIIRSCLFSGFPWNVIGYIWLFNLNFAQFANIVGLYGMSYIAVLISLIPVLLFSKKAILFDKLCGFLLIILLITLYFYGYNSINSKNFTDSSKKIKARIVQSNIDQKEKWNEEERYDNVDKYINLTRSKSLDNIDVVIWSETSIPFPINIQKENHSIINYLSPAIPVNGHLISGAIRYEDSENIKLWNSLFVFNSTNITGYYDKKHLVPFGEYVPFHKYLSFLFIDDIVDKITGGGEGFMKGNEPKLIKLSNFSFNALICYEIIFTHEMLDSNKKLPDVFFNITNDAWFGNSSGPYQHLKMAQMRAIEYGKPIIRVAQTGISANINHHGIIENKIDLGVKDILDVDVYFNNNETFYYKYSQYISMVIIVFSLLIILLSKIIKIKIT